jgi:hypothetical protein
MKVTESPFLGRFRTATACERAPFCLLPRGLTLEDNRLIDRLCKD